MTAEGSRKKGILPYLSAEEFSNFQRKKTQDDFYAIGLYYQMNGPYWDSPPYSSQPNSQNLLI